MAELLKIYNDSIKHTSAIGFVNDINILIYGTDSGRNCLKLINIYRKYLKWAAKYKAKFVLHKYKLMHFVKKKNEWVKAILNLNEIKIKLVALVKILKV